MIAISSIITIITITTTIMIMIKIYDYYVLPPIDMFQRSLKSR